MEETLSYPLWIQIVIAVLVPILVITTIVVIIKMIQTKRGRKRERIEREKRLEKKKSEDVSLKSPEQIYKEIEEEIVYPFNLEQTKKIMSGMIELESKEFLDFLFENKFAHKVGYDYDSGSSFSVEYMDIDVLTFISNEYEKIQIKEIVNDENISLEDLFYSLHLFKGPDEDFFKVINKMLKIKKELS